MRVFFHVTAQRFYFTLAVVFYTVVHLVIEYFGGGVAVHYPLMREDLPALSNWWGLLLLPSLGWISYHWMEKDSSTPAVAGLSQDVYVRLFGALMYGGVIGGSFMWDVEPVPGYMMLALFAIGIIYPLYRAEIIQGLIMGMVYAFGAIIPSVVIGIVALSSLLLHTIAKWVLHKIQTI